MLASIYADADLSHTWKAFAFCYGSPSHLLIRDGGTVIDTISSQQGGKQGCVLTGLGFAHLFQPFYTAATADLPNVTARAIVDDFTIVGPPKKVFKAYDRLLLAADRVGVSINTTKTKVQLPRGDASEGTLEKAAERLIGVVRGNFKYLGGSLGVDDDAARTWLKHKLATHSTIRDAVTEERLPALLALTFAKLCELPIPMYLTRTLPLRVTLPQDPETPSPLRDFDTSLRQAITRRLQLPDPLPTSAFQSFIQPVGGSGHGFRSYELIAPAAKWASAAAVAPDIEHFASAARNDRTLPFVADRDRAHATMVAAGVETTTLPRAAQIPVDEEKAAEEKFANERFKILPRNPSIISSFYDGASRLPTLQRMLSRQLEASSLNLFLNSPECTRKDALRILSCKSKCSGAWLSPCPSLPTMKDFAVRVAMRLRMGLPPPVQTPTRCALCKRDMQNDPWHAFACESVRRLSTTRAHDIAAQQICDFARANNCLASVQFVPDSLIPDGQIHLTTETILYDVSGVHILAPSHLPSATPGAAIKARETAKHTKYDDYAREMEAKLVPVALDRFGSLGDEAKHLINVIADESDTPGLTSFPTRKSTVTFLHELSTNWQIGNANILKEWLKLSRMERLAQHA